jgi:hypothetical protein
MLAVSIILLTSYGTLTKSFMRLRWPVLKSLSVVKGATVEPFTTLASAVSKVKV